MKSSITPVGAGVTVLSFRKNIQELDEEYYKNGEMEYSVLLEKDGIDPRSLSDKKWEKGAMEFARKSPKSDLHILLSKTINCKWSAPKQDLLNGALFFYLGNRSLANVHRCIRQAKEDGWQEYPSFWKSLHESAAFIEKNQGSVIGAAKVLNIPGPGAGPGFRRRVFAEIDGKNFCLFKNPLPYAVFQNICPIYGQTVASLAAEKANWLREELRKNNTLPAWLESMMFGESKYSEINAVNWLDKIREPYIFIEDDQKQEETIRAYFLNFLLNELKDKNTYYREECTTWKKGNRTGRADYFVKLFGEWIPFEAKVSVRTEVDISSQIRQYIDIDSFEYNDIQSEGTETTCRKKYQDAGKHKICLLGDQFGVYLTQNGKFVNCSAEKPLRSRTEMSKKTIEGIKAIIKQYLN